MSFFSIYIFLERRNINTQLLLLSVEVLIYILKNVQKKTLYNSKIYTCLTSDDFWSSILTTSLISCKTKN